MEITLGHTYRWHATTEITIYFDSKTYIVFFYKYNICHLLKISRDNFRHPRKKKTIIYYFYIHFQKFSLC